MPTILPFRAVRPPAHKAAHVLTRTYQDYSHAELEVLLEHNPFTFLQILNPGYKFHQELKGSERFTMVRNRYLEFIEDETLIQDASACLYVYQKSDRHHTYTGIIANTTGADYQADRIKKHENTLAKREELFKEYLMHVGFNAEPVLLTYKENESLKAQLDHIVQGEPVMHCVTTDQHEHKLWAVQDPLLIEQLQASFAAMDSVYIADGHHRSASSYLLGVDGDRESYKQFMSYLIPEHDLQIQEFNRLVKDLNGHSKESFLMKLDAWFRIENRGAHLYQPSKQHHFSMYLDGEFYSLYLRKTRYNFTDPLSTLDTHILYDLVLKPILGIEDERTDTRIQYTSGEEDIVCMKDAIDDGTFAVGFNPFPVTVEQMKQIADAGQVMPPKSTYILPKLHSGLTIYQY